jgi:CubicO group peptidase (beta-lactamase class C family)
VLGEYDGCVDLTVAARDGRGYYTAGVLSHTPLPVFSVTKTFVATAVLRLVERHQLRLDGEVSRWLSRAPRGLTVRGLLGHTGGLPDYATDPAYVAAVAAQPGQPWGLDEILTIGLAGDRSAPGRFRYSNLGYWMLGAVLEQVAAGPLGQTLASAVFEPAGMTSTVYPEVGAGVTDDGYDTRWAGPAGAVWSTPTDMIAFLDALFDQSLISAASLTAMTAATPVVAGPPWRQPGYGLGLMVDSRLGAFGHGGDGPGYRSAAFTAPSLGRSVALVAQAAGADPIAVALRALRIDK